MIEKPPSTARLLVTNFVRNTTGMIGLLIVFLVVTSSIFAVQLSGYEPTLMDGSVASLPPSTSHLMGTDQLGQDVFSRVLYGGRNSVLIGVLASFLGNLFGTVLGAIAGYIGGKFDTILIRLSELVMTFPQLVLVLIFVTFLGQGVTNVIFIFAITGWMTTFRLVRSEFLSLREEAFVEADRAFGFSKKRIIFRHLLPNTMSPIVVAFTINTAIYIIAEAGLSFLGLGVPVTTPTWGNLLAAAQAPVVVEQYWWLWVFPALAIIVFVTGVNFIGDGLRDVLDPRTRSGSANNSFSSAVKEKILGSRRKSA
jgi:peptide/nickel transport system permease protein